MKRKRHLRHAGLRPNTLRAYSNALSRFLKFVNKQKLDVSRFHKLDQQVAEFINDAYQDDQPISTAGHLLSALKRYFPQLRLEMPRASQMYRNWQRCYHPQRATPASWSLVEAMMAVALDRDQASFALLLALGFHGLLRTNEMLGLTHQSVVFHQDGHALSIILSSSKTSQGNPQVLLVQDEELLSFARSVIRPASRSSLWKGSATSFRDSFQGLLAELGFPPQTYHPYSLRRGGATWWFQTTLSIDATVARGRWSSAATAKQYIDEGTAQLAQLAWTSRQQTLVTKWCHRGRYLRLRQKQKRSGVGRGAGGKEVSPFSG